MRPSWKADADFQPLREVLIQQHLASRRWTTPQRQSLQRISNKSKAITIVDREELDADLLYFKRGGAAGRG